MLVITTIKATRSLHKPHIIFIANVMVTDIVFTIEVFLSSAIMMIGFASGEGDLISSNLHLFLHYPVVVIYLTFLMISVDKVIAIKFPFRL